MASQPPTAGRPLKDLTTQCKVDAEQAGKGWRAFSRSTFYSCPDVWTFAQPQPIHVFWAVASEPAPPPAQAKASVEDDALAIKKHIQKEHKSFEYVNQTVEQALWCEVIKVLEQSEPSEMSKTGSTVASNRTDGSCNLQ
jgi:hypothetical protein